jgi:hypothetical protein
MHDILQDCPPVVEPGVPVAGSISRDLLDAQAEIRRLNLQIRLWKEYHAFLNEAHEGAITLAWNHGWRCPDDVYQRGVEFRKKLGIPNRNDEYTPNDKFRCSTPTCDVIAICKQCWGCPEHCVHKAKD